MFLFVLFCFLELFTELRSDFTAVGKDCCQISIFFFVKNVKIKSIMTNERVDDNDKDNNTPACCRFYPTAAGVTSAKWQWEGPIGGEAGGPRRGEGLSRWGRWSG